MKSSARVHKALGDVLDLVIDHRGKTPGKLGGDFESSGVPVVSAIHIKAGQIKWDERERFVSHAMYEKWMPKKLCKGDLLLTSEAPLGEVALVNSDDPLVLSQRLFALRGKKEILETRYLFYFFQSAQGQQALSERSSGTTVSGIRQSELLKIEIPLPSFQEQVKIAGVLKSLDDLMLANKLQMDNLDELAMSCFLGTWDGVSASRIDAIGEVVMGQSPAGETLNEEYDGMVFYQGVTDFEDRYPTPRVFCTAPSRQASQGDIMIAVRAPVGDTNVATEDTAIGRGVAALKAKYPAIALRALRAAESTWAPYQGGGTVFSSITGPDLRGAKVPYFENDDLEASLKNLDELHYGLNVENAKLLRTRGELLPLLLSGSITVKDEAA